MSPPRLSRAVVLALALASFACQKSSVECMPLPAVTCPDGGGPAFDTEVLPIFVQVCDNCHAPNVPQPDRQAPYLTNYQQIYGPGGSVASEVRYQVFDSCRMPPANAPVPLSDDDRQTLHIWIACGAPNSPAVDAGAAD